MKYFVNSDCIGCGHCIELCPAVFSFSVTKSDTAEAISEDIPEEENVRAQHAQDSCPASAIHRMV